ncbi:hypothetical protein KP79_PYT05894 [Mizuhopecten yessoensis]|uniref:Uncharacterized protein n=1 Tax=Mizuhopecten yessoensis TaxID=6573 RepID=A0A210QIB8_MIZYE|nr:hypothetical protein KP79_PYT05894 [Mizuhopecten yessoensis]
MLKFSKGKKVETDEEEKINRDKSPTDKAMASSSEDKVTTSDTKSKREEALVEVLERERKNFKRQKDEVTKEMLLFKAENEKLRHAIKHEHGTPEVSEKIKKELDHLRSTNRFLLENLERRKRQISKLETDVFELDMKLQSVNNSLAETERKNQDMKEEMVELIRDRVLINSLMDDNRKLRHFLSINNLDTRTGKRMLNHVIKRNQKLPEDESGSITDRSERAMRDRVDGRLPEYSHHIQSKRKIQKN